MWDYSKRTLRTDNVYNVYEVTSLIHKITFSFLSKENQPIKRLIHKAIGFEKMMFQLKLLKPVSTIVKKLQIDTAANSFFYIKVSFL